MSSLYRRFFSCLPTVRNATSAENGWWRRQQNWRVQPHPTKSYLWATKVNRRWCFLPNENFLTEQFSRVKASGPYNINSDDPIFISGRENDECESCCQEKSVVPKFNRRYFSLLIPPLNSLECQAGFWGRHQTQHFPAQWTVLTIETFPWNSKKPYIRWKMKIT